MTSRRGYKPHQPSTTITNQEETPESRIDASTEPQQQSTRNASKRSKDGDDSFEREHRMANPRNQYFNSSNSRLGSSTTAARPASNSANLSSRRPTFPPFRLNFTGEETPSELSIIKSINRHCHIGLSYGRFASMGEKKSFLLYANSSEQFERPLDRNIWPLQLCEQDYTTDFPSKVPASYSLVALGIPAQWNLTELEDDLKRQYPSIIRIERLYIKGGVPISKVRIDFSSNQEVNNVLKNKRLLLDDENTSFAIQSYTPPFKVLRCFNCQQYNDHVAAHCPHKDNPICFRCVQHHPFNPLCSNKICCANCGQEHMAGNPNCSTKIEERRKHQFNSASSTTINEPKQRNASSSSVWSSNPVKRITHTGPLVSVEEEPSVSGRNGLSDISKKLDMLMVKMELISAEQTKFNSSINNTNHLITQCNKEIDAMKEFIYNQICPFVCQLGEVFLCKSKQVGKERLRPLLVQFKKVVEETIKSTGDDQRAAATLPNSSSDESLSDDI